MSRAGNVIINWHQPAGQLVELEFGRSHIEYYLESSGEEGEIAFNSDDATKLVGKINSLSAAA
jgi:hypothetical protein